VEPSGELRDVVLSLRGRTQSPELKRQKQTASGSGTHTAQPFRKNEVPSLFLIRDGSLWLMGCVSYSTEADAGVVFNTWFGGRLLKPQDRLNSIGKYFPYGEDRTSPTPANPPNGQEKFATYTRDAETGLDYAHQRYYTAGLGRFMTPDPYSASAGLGVPQSFNRYAYTDGDPVTFNDRTGLFISSSSWNGCYVDDLWISGCDLPGLNFMSQSFVRRSPFQKAVDRLTSAVESFNDRVGFSKRCQDDIAAIAASAPSYVDPTSVTSRGYELREWSMVSGFAGGPLSNLASGRSSRG
jgi:RHS repeat-associated protein